MSSREVKDEEGRMWKCQSTGAGEMGKDVNITCTTASEANPVSLRVGWNWEKIGDKGLARMIAAAVT
jgi:hypothetical protein